MNEEAGASLHPAISNLGWWFCLPAPDSFPLGVPDSHPFWLQVKCRSHPVLWPAHPGPCDFQHAPLLSAHPASPLPIPVPHLHRHLVLLLLPPPDVPVPGPAFPSGGPDSASLTAFLRIDSFTENKQKSPKLKTKQTKHLIDFLAGHQAGYSSLRPACWTRCFSQAVRILWSASPGLVKCGALVVTQQPLKTPLSAGI